MIVDKLEVGETFIRFALVPQTAEDKHKLIKLRKNAVGPNHSKVKYEGLNGTGEVFVADLVCLEG